MLWICAFAGIVLTRQVIEPSRSIQWIRLIRNLATLVVLVALVARYGFDTDDLIGVAGRKAIYGGLLAGAGLLLIGFLLVALTPENQRFHARSAFLRGPSGSLFRGPATCCLGLFFLFLITWADTAYLAFQEEQAAAAGIPLTEYQAIFSVLSFLIPLLSFVLITINVAIINLLQADAGHPLLPSLAAPWFAISAIIVDKVTEKGTNFDLAPARVDDAIQLGGLIGTIACSLLEITILRETLGVSLTSGLPPHRRLQRSRGRSKYQWLPFPGYPADTPLARRVARFDQP